MYDGPKREFVYAPPAGKIPIVHRGEDYLIIDKPAGLLSVPGKHDPDCVEARLRAVHPDALTIHRLDMATSGLMVFALTPHAQRHFGLQFENRQVQKTYVARVGGIVDGEGGIIDEPLIADWPNRPRQKVCYEHGKSAVTEWRVSSREDDVTRMTLYPKTGRSHQLRVHMAWLGHPILGDMIYAPDPLFLAADRLQLHAQKIRFREPTGGAWVEYEVPAPF
ncbi:RluA family pseudouridine synthase [Litorimonas sp. RW-G-Af-16]|uniref:RluA family pseudouridine synthase n=1 Tax=Litorimonas sp. RW-G-Af-16 TaxID=3241168 RepID=UPI00390CD253